MSWIFIIIIVTYYLFIYLFIYSTKNIGIATECTIHLAEVFREQVVIVLVEHDNVL